MTEPGTAPLLTVLRGDPSREQLAALVVAVAGRSSGTSDAGSDTPTSALWSVPIAGVPLPRGPGAWRASGLPR